MAVPASQLLYYPWGRGPLSRCGSSARLFTVSGTLAMDHSQAFLDLVNARRSRVKELSVSQTRDRLRENPDAHLIDVREDSEWSNGHAAGAEHIGKGVIERDIESAIPDRSAEVILYCGGGFRSILAADSLQQMGYTNVASMAGGWREWRDSGAPTE